MKTRRMKARAHEEIKVNMLKNGGGSGEHRPGAGRVLLGALVALATLAALAVPPTEAQVISKGKEVAIFQTAFGKIVIELFPETAPKHVATFKKNIREGVYAGTIVHQIVPGFVIKAGDPLTKNPDPANYGQGGFGPPIPNEYNDLHKNRRGAVGAIRKPDSVNVERASNGFQFYIALADLPALDASKHTVFGRVIEGLDIVDRIAAVNRDEKGVPRDRLEFKKVYLEAR
jgi:cyclophilin family peptidyl-prolyl cis-trans isomerase